MRLIDADALRDKLHELASDVWNQMCRTFWANVYNECADMVDDQPTIESQKWVPVSERLPEYKQAVLTYIGYLDDYEVNWICDEDDEWYHYGVTAWMELPDPYGENKN